MDQHELLSDEIYRKKQVLAAMEKEVQDYGDTIKTFLDKIQEVNKQIERENEIVVVLQGVVKDKQ